MSRVSGMVHSEYSGLWVHAKGPQSTGTFRERKLCSLGFAQSAFGLEQRIYNATSSPFFWATVSPEAF